MIHGDTLKAAVPNHSRESQVVLDALQLAQRTRTVQRLDDAAGDWESFRIARAIRGHRVVATHRILDAVRLNVAGGGEDGRLRNAVGVHDPHPVGVVALLPIRALLQAAAAERAEMMMDVENFHDASGSRFESLLTAISGNLRMNR